MKFQSKYNIFHSQKCVRKYHLGNGGHFVQGIWVNIHSKLLHRWPTSAIVVCGHLCRIPKLPICCSQCWCAYLHSLEYKTWIIALIARFMGPTWGPSGADRTEVDPMLAIWASNQIHKIVSCACAWNAWNVFPATDFKGNRMLAIPACITTRASRTRRDACRDC